LPALLLLAGAATTYRRCYFIHCGPVEAVGNQEVFEQHDAKLASPKAIILKCDYNAGHTPQFPAQKKHSSTLFSMACDRCCASLVACRVEPCGRAVD
jgi:hypothetical protein